jgi:glycosyltransferase involved in cell wall biosynthesis
VPRVSVIVAAKNAADTLPATLASIAAQSYTDWEVVLVDDGSSDATAAIAREFDGPISVYANAASQGPSSARNTAVEHASGELLATLDSDDTWKPDFLWRTVDAYDRCVAEGRRIGLVSTDAELVSAAGQSEASYLAWVGYRAPVTLDSMLVNNVLPSIVLCPRAVFAELGGYDASIRHGEDFDLWLRILEAGYEVHIVEHVLATYTVRGDAASADTARLATGAAHAYDLALHRGHLTPRQRRIAKRQRRLYRAVAARATIAGDALAGRPTLIARLRMIPATIGVALTHPERWLVWLRRGVRDPGPSRHA